MNDSDYSQKYLSHDINTQTDKPIICMEISWQY